MRRPGARRRRCRTLRFQAAQTRTSPATTAEPGGMWPGAQVCGWRTTGVAVAAVLLFVNCPDGSHVHGPDFVRARNDLRLVFKEA
jgi:hypothetical protein